MARSPVRGPTPRIVTPGSMRRGNPVQFFREAIAELRKAVWPTREQTVRLTYIIILLSTAVGFLLAGLDAILGETFGKFVIR